MKHPREFDLNEAAKEIGGFPVEREHILPILHRLCELYGFVPETTVPLIAGHLNLSNSDVYGVIHFYDDFRSVPPGKTTVKICRAEACRAVGSVSLEKHAKTALGVDYHQTTADGKFTLEEIYCLGNCSCGPSVMIGERVHGRVDPAKFDALTGGGS